MTKQIIFFDTETTGNTEKDYLCQLAYKTKDTEFNNLYKPPIPIPPEASAIHHISNKMVEDKPSFKGSSDYQNVKDLFENENNFVVAHNAAFDLNMLKKEEIIPKNFICTLRVARALDPEGKIEKYNLQYLRYLLGIEIEAEAHDALGDVLVLEKLFERLFNKIKTTDNLDDEGAIEKMAKISSHPSIFKHFNFGKYVGQEISNVAKEDRGYLEWLLKQKQEGGQIDEDWIYTLKHYLGMLQ
jgi:DNA polymerase III epsilon subunit-like protein